MDAIAGVLFFLMLFLLIFFSFHMPYCILTGTSDWVEVHRKQAG